MPPIKTVSEPRLDTRRALRQPLRRFPVDVSTSDTHSDAVAFGLTQALEPDEMLHETVATPGEASDLGPVALHGSAFGGLGRTVD